MLAAQPATGGTLGDHRFMLVGESPKLAAIAELLEEAVQRAQGRGTVLEARKNIFMVDGKVGSGGWLVGRWEWVAGGSVDLASTVGRWVAGGEAGVGDGLAGAWPMVWWVSAEGCWAVLLCGTWFCLRVIMARKPYTLPLAAPALSLFSCCCLVASLCSLPWRA